MNLDRQTPQTEEGGQVCRLCRRPAECHHIERMARNETAVAADWLWTMLNLV